MKIILRLPFRLSLLSILIAQLASAQNNTTGCLIPGDEDLFGIGIRIGLYFQILSNFVIALLHPEEAYDTFLPNLFFFTGIVVALVYTASQTSPPPGSLIACTWFPLMMFTSFAPAMTATDENPKMINMLFRLLAYHVLLLSFLCVNLWFWFKEVDVVDPAQCMVPRVFFFANLSAHSGIRVLFRIFCVLATLLTLMLIITSIIGIRAQLNDQEPRPVNPIPVKPWIQSVFKFMSNPVPSRIFAAAYLAFVILAFELQLRWNHIDGINSVNSSGQIIPLTIGTLSLLQAIVSVTLAIRKAVQDVQNAREAEQDLNRYRRRRSSWY
jgi:hypothetical protein